MANNQLDALICWWASFERRAWAYGNPDRLQRCCRYAVMHFTFGGLLKGNADFFAWLKSIVRQQQRSVSIARTVRGRGIHNEIPAFSRFDGYAIGLCSYFNYGVEKLNVRYIHKISRV